MASGIFGFCYDQQVPSKDNHDPGPDVWISNMEAVSLTTAGINAKEKDFATDRFVLKDDLIVHKKLVVIFWRVEH